MEYSTKVTTRLVKKGMSDLADLVENYMMKGKQYDSGAAKALYGGWQLLSGNWYWWAEMPIFYNNVRYEFEL